MGFLVVLICAVGAIPFHLLQKRMREERNEGHELTVFWKCVLLLLNVVLAFLVYVIVAFAVCGFLERLVREMGTSPDARSNDVLGVVSFLVSFVMCYSIWLGGWDVGRTEGLRTAEKLRRDADSAKH